ncbi:phosphoenolpyruvate carboxylase [Pseudoalteromonas sp. BZB3]|uniref:phosphoenolpyruvate carboxylase n=1 Tax=Pseudoalteromonas sp. BZB3 TaxID=3136670 RepID=UPI0032C49580
MGEQYENLRANVSQLGGCLGRIIQQTLGEGMLEKIEQIRLLAKSSRKGDSDARIRLLDTLHSLTDRELLPVARAFNHFLNLANVAEQFHTISVTGAPEGIYKALNEQVEKLSNMLANDELNHEQVESVLAGLDIDLVLTAHPTEVTRRTIINKHVQLSDCLSALELQCLDVDERKVIISRIEQLISQAWHTNDIRAKRPTPLDEAKWGYAVIENSLWHAVPQFIRYFNQVTQDKLGIQLKKIHSPIRFTSWMGGDRDGNPFVNSEVTQSVLDHGRWMAIDLISRDIDMLSSELSMYQADEHVKSLIGEQHEPYRYLLKQLKGELDETIQALENKIKGEVSSEQEVIAHIEQVKSPLTLIYNSLHNCNMSQIADGLLLDTLLRLECFGINLCSLDIRQDSARHADAIAAIVEHLELGDYNAWSEAQKQQFLIEELASKRPLLPKNLSASDEVEEVLKTCQLVSQQTSDRLGIYIISMAQYASDVLAVKLLLKETGCRFNLPVAPLFETLDDLNRGADVISQLLACDWYRTHINHKQYVMIGYSDSAKDAGMMAAGWAQYQAMDKLLKAAKDFGVELVLFHGRGGTVGRGGAPAAQALQSQPPGSLSNGLRVTEQGEMIRFKYGLPKVAVQSFSIYTSAIIEANLTPVPSPKSHWIEVVELIAQSSCNYYRQIVRENPDFVAYFRQVTPELELAKLPLGSRPSKRNPNGGVESLRAIPWIFAWSQNRLMLPAWLGVYQGLQAAIDKYGVEILHEMRDQWPFFRTRLEMLEMVFCKTDAWLSEHYEKVLMTTDAKSLGLQLRHDLKSAQALITELAPGNTLLLEQPWLRQSLQLRNPYIDPLNLLQVELLKRTREHENEQIDQALMVTMTGVAAGMRNSG